ncbi:adhesion G protein-coupled receptor L4-like [Amphiura filiformis]|uniref:adhesion G protein-coupled receptor L4-like n=1 Tax=Amphiura filiformis TaxID=82378 RepID=UPI003B216653
MQNEPSTNAGQDCLVRTNQGQLKALSCSTNMPFICEYDNTEETTMLPSSTHGVTTGVHSTESSSTNTDYEGSGTTMFLYSTNEVAMVSHAATTHSATTPLPQNENSHTQFQPTSNSEETTSVLLGSETAHSTEAMSHTTNYPQTLNNIESTNRRTSTVVTTAPLVDDIDASLLTAFKSEIMDLLGSELSSIWSNALDTDDLPISDGITRLESNEYVLLAASTADMIDAYEIDCAVEEATHRVIFPAETVTVFKASWVSVGIPKFLNETSLSNVKPPYRLGSRIMSITLFDKNGNVIPYEGEEPVHITFELTDTDTEQQQKPICKYFNNVKRIWSDKGCALHQTNETHVTCYCYHLSSFAVLMAINSDLEFAAIHYKVFKYLGYVGMSLSILCLTLTLIIYGICRLYKRPRIIIHANLAASLLIADLIFVTGVEAKSESACKAVGVLLHYFFLVAFMWMLFEGVHLYLKISPTVKITMKLHVCMVIAWGIPMLIAVITVAIRHELYAANGSFRCFLPRERGVLYALYVPICCIFLVNFFILFSTVRIFLTLKANKDKSEVDRIRAGLRAVLILSPVLGLTFIFGFLMNIPSVGLALISSVLIPNFSSLAGRVYFHHSVSNG